MAAIAHPPQQISVVLTNMLSAVVTSVEGDTIKWFSPDEALLVATPVDEALSSRSARQRLSSRRK